MISRVIPWVLPPPPHRTTTGVRGADCSAAQCDRSHATQVYPQTLWKYPQQNVPQCTLAIHHNQFCRTARWGWGWVVSHPVIFSIPGVFLQETRRSRKVILGKSKLADMTEDGRSLKSSGGRKKINSTYRQSVNDTYVMSENRHQLEPRRLQPHRNASIHVLVC